MVGIGADDTKLSSSVTIVVVMDYLLNSQGRNLLKSNPRVMSPSYLSAQGNQLELSCADTSPGFSCSGLALAVKLQGFSLKWNQSENQSKFPPFPNLEGLVRVRFQQQKM